MRKLTIMLTALFLFLISPVISAEENDKNFYYYIMIDRFQIGSLEEENIDMDDPLAHHGGDFAGIINRLDYLKTLGVTHIILSPIFESDSFTGFENVNYDQIQPTFGTEEELSNLVKKFNDEGIEVILHFPIDESALPLSEIVSVIEQWVNKLSIAGIYLQTDEDISNDFYESVRKVLNNKLFIGHTNQVGNEDELLSLGFDKIVSPMFQQIGVDLFSGKDKSVELLTSNELYDERIVHYLELYDTDRFANQVNDIGYHPVTHWKLALTYLMTIPNDLIIYQGSEVALGGFKEDNSNNQMMTFLTGDDQIIRLIEKISDANKRRDSLAKGNFDILHAEDGYFVYIRTFEDESTLVAINLSDTIQHAEINLDPNLEFRGMLLNDLVRENEDGTYIVTLKREESNVFVVQQDTGIYWPMVLVFLGVMAIFVTFIVVMSRKNKKEQKSSS